MNTWTTRLLLVGLLLVLVNFPALHGAWLDRQLDAEGVTEATPAEPSGDPAGRRVVVTFPPALDGEADAPPAPTTPQPAEGEGLVQQVTTLEPEAYDEAVDSESVEVTYLPDDPSTYRIEGEAEGLFAITLLIGNAAVLLVVGLFLLGRGRARAELRLRATDDVRRAAPGGVLERVAGNEYRVCGDIEELGPDELLLDVGGRPVRVVLDGHANPAGYQQSVEVRGLMIG